MKLQSISKNDYQEYLSTLKDNDFLQSTHAASKFMEDGWQIEYVKGTDQDETKAVAMICIRPLLRFFNYAYVPRGFFIDYHNKKDLRDFSSVLKAHLKSKKVIYLEIDPDILYKERDKNGQIVPDGINNQDIVDNLIEAGYRQMPLTKGYDLSKQCRWMSILDLRNKSIDDIFNGFSTMQKRNIRTAQKCCVKTRILSQDELNILDKMETESSERQQFESMPLSYFESMYRHYGTQHIKTVYGYLDLEEYEAKIKEDLIHTENEIQKLQLQTQKDPSAKKKIKNLENAQTKLSSLTKKKEEIATLKKTHDKEVPLSCCMFVQYKNQMIYLFGGNDYAYRAYRGSYAVQWEMIQEAVRAGCDYYNMYGISGYFEKGEEGYGVFDFKRGFNCTVVEFIGRYHLVFHPFFYWIHKKLHKNI